MQNILHSSRHDWMYIILSTLSGFFMIGFYFLLKDGFSLLPETALLITFILFSLFFDVRHFFPTYTRTFLDKSYFQENKRWLIGSTLAIILIPMMSYLFLIQGEAAAYDGSLVVAFARRVTLVLGFYHLIKQNWGFIAIYKKKFNEPENGSDRWEKLVLLSGSFLPLVLLSKNDPIWFSDEVSAFTPSANELSYVLEFWDKLAGSTFLLGIGFLLVGFVLKTRVQYKYVSRNLGFYFIGIFILIKSIMHYGSESVLNVLIVALTITFFVSLALTIQKAIAFGKFNTRKWAMLGSALFLYWGILSIPVDNNLLHVIGITIPHNIQYLSFVRFFNKKQFENEPNKHGIAYYLTQRVLLFFAVSVVFSAIFELGRTGTIHLSDTNSFILRNTVAIFFLSLVLHHYYLDAVIWRVRKDEKLSKNV